MKLLRKEDELMDRELKTVKPAGAEGKDGKEDEETAQDKGGEAAAPKKEEKVDFQALKSLSDDGIDMSFLDSLRGKYETELKVEEESAKTKEETPTPEDMLSKTASLLEELRRVQHERLSSTPPQHFSSMPKAGEKECKLASILEFNSNPSYHKFTTNHNSLSTGVRSAVEPGGHGQENGARQRRDGQQRETVAGNPDRQGGGRAAGRRGASAGLRGTGCRRADGSVDSLSIFPLDVTQFVAVLNVI